MPFKPNKKGVITGTKKKDKITWTSSWERALTVKTGRGNDTINFKKSKYKNKLFGGSGNDKIYGGKKTDTIHGNAGADLLYGRNGNDTLYGGNGNDYIEGGADSDKVFGGAGNDTIKGGKGNDIINAGTGYNSIYLYDGDGQDIAVNGGGHDTLIFTLNTDVFTEHINNDLIVHYGNGNDKVTLQNYADGHSVKNIKIGNTSYSINDFEPTSIYLSRGEYQNSITLTSEKTLYLTLENPFGAENYTYTITTAKAAQILNLNFLQNGRLRIEGNNLNITAGANQEDDIILWGNYNSISTNDSDDIVRLGGAVDSGGTTEYIRQSNRNNVNTGAGNDYIIYCGFENVINGGDGEDYALALNSPLTNVNSAYVRDIDSNIANSTDGNIGWINQGVSGGDCRLLSLIHSLGNTLSSINKTYSDYVNISLNDDTYTVTFQNYNHSEKSNTTTIRTNELASFGHVAGDLDVVLTDFALNKLIAQNQDHGKTSVMTAAYNTLSDYLFGNEDFTYLHSTETAQDKI